MNLCPAYALKLTPMLALSIHLRMQSPMKPHPTCGATAEPVVSTVGGDGIPHHRTTASGCDRLALEWRALSTLPLRYPPPAGPLMARLAAMHALLAHQFGDGIEGRHEHDQRRDDAGDEAGENFAAFLEDADGVFSGSREPAKLL